LRGRSSRSAASADPPGSDFAGALRLSEERLAILLAASGQALYEVDFPTGEARFTNEYARMLGYDPDALKPTFAWWAQQLHPDDRQRMARLYERCATGLEQEYADDYRILTRAGEWKWIHSAGRIVDRDREGRPLRMVGSHLDIDARKKTEASLRASNRLLAAIGQAQALLIAGAGQRETFERMLESLLQITGSEYGFIGEVQRDADGTPFLRTHAISDVAWNDETRALFAARRESGMEFRRLDSLFGSVLVTGEPVVANEPAADARAAGLPDGHPRLDAFMGLPFFHGSEMVGMVGIANRAGGYSHDMLALLQPLLATCATIIHAVRERERRKAAEQARETLVALAEGSGDLIAWADLDGTLRYINPAGRAMIGLTRKDPIGRLHIADCHREDVYRGVVECIIPEVLAKGQWEGEMEFFDRAAGRPVPVRQEVFLLRGADGSPQGLATIARDITDLKRMTDALRQSEKKFATAFRTAPDSIGISRLRDDLYLDVNEGFSRITGWSAEEAIGRTSAELGIWNDPADRQHFAAALQQGGEVRNMEVVLRRKEGSPFTALVSATPIRVGDEECILTVARDISDRIRVEVALRESEALHREAQRAARLGHWRLDEPKGRPHWSEQVFRLFGLDPAGDEPSFDTFLRVHVHPEDRTLVAGAWDAAVCDGRDFLIQHRGLTADGALRHFELRGIAQRGADGRAGLVDGRPGLVFGTVMDVTERVLVEQALRESETRHREAQRTARLGHWDFDLMGGRHRWSEEVFRLFGFDPSLGQPDPAEFEAIVHPEDLGRLQESWARAVRDQEVFMIEHRVRLPDGTVRHVEARGVPHRNAAGEVVRLAGTVMDITERKLGEIALRESQALFRDIAGSIKDVFWVSNADQSRILYVSPPVEQVWGLPPQSFLDHPWLWFEMVHENDRDNVRGCYEALIERGAEFDVEYRIVRHDGEMRWIHDRGYRVSEGDRAARVVGVAEDISARRQAELELEQSHAWLRQALVAARAGAWSWETATNRVVWSEENYALMGLAPGACEAGYERWLERVHPEDRAGANAAVSEAMTNRSDLDIEFRVVLDDGSIRWIQDAGRTVLGAEGEPAGMYGIQIDITERKRAEAALRDSEQQLAEAHRIAGLGRWELDLTTQALLWSDTIFELFEIDPARFGASLDAFLAVVHPEDRDELMRVFWRSVEERQPYQIEHRLRMPDGRVKWVREMGRTEHDESGRALRTVGTVQDVTLSRAAQEAVRLSERRYRELFEFAAVSIWEHDFRAVWALRARLRESGVADVRAHLDAHPGLLAETMKALTVRDVNRAGLRLYGGQDKEALIRGGLELIATPDLVPRVADVIAAFCAGAGRFEAEVQFRTATGEIRDTLVTMDFPGCEAEADRLLVSVLDVTDRKRAEAAAREAEKRWQIAVEGADIAIFDWDVPSGKVFLSDRWKTMLGYRPDELENAFATWERLCHPEDLPRALRAVQAHFAGELPVYVVPHRLLAKDGSYRWVEARGQVMQRDAAGKPLRMLGTHTDIHQARLDQERIEALSERLQLALRVGKLGIWERDLVRNVSIWDDRILETFGYARDAFAGTDEEFFDRVHPEDRPALQRAVAEAIAGNDRFACEFRVVAPGRDPVWQYSIAHVARDEQGAAVRVVGVNIDVTASKRVQAELEALNRNLEELVAKRTGALTAEIAERRRAQADLQRAQAELEQRVAERTAELSRVNASLRLSEQQLAEAQRIARLGRYEYEFEADRLHWSHSVFDIVGRDRDGFRGCIQDFLDCVHPDDREQETRAMAEAAAGTAAYDRVIRALSRDGAVRWLHSIGRFERDAEGKALRVVGTVQDVTGLKRAEQALKELNATLEARVQSELARNREKDHLLIQQSRFAAMGEMIGNIAHQWRQPINALALLLSNLQDAWECGELSGEYIKSQAERGNALIQRMSATIEDFCNFFKPNRAPQPFRVMTAVHDALAIVESAYEHSSIRIEVEARGDPLVLGFANEYTQVLLNLLANAKQAIRERGARNGRVNIVVEGEGDVARLTVRDNGGGIAPDIMGRIFDPYFTTRESGTGIGLYMSKMIIESNMSGRIAARNVDEGAEFSVVTPLAEPAAAG
jgi:PAS domain S-box-containing protein